MVNRRPAKFSSAQLAEIETALSEGNTPEEIARTFGLSRTALVHRLNKMGKDIGVTRHLVNINVTAEPALDGLTAVDVARAP